MAIIRQCAFCGAYFESMGGNRRYCSGDCATKSKNQSSPYKAAKMSPKKKKIKTLDEMAAEAKRLGISYGQLSTRLREAEKQ